MDELEIIEEPVTIYTINVGDFQEYSERCLSASFGGSGISSETIPWANTEYNPWDYKADFEMVEVEIEEPVIDEEGNETGETSTRIESQKQYTGTFTLDPIVIEEPTPMPTQLDMIEAQVMYTALMTDTLIEEE